MNEAPAPLSPPPASLELRDFSDRLPPVLVKELRQGLRARMFIIPFLILHGLLLIGTLEPGSGSSSFFHWCLIIMLVALLPMRNLGALSDERHANTLDTLILTRLTPWRIVWGKWCATAALVLLTAVSALPYLLVRYLNGGTTFVMEAAGLALLVLVSGALTAVLTAVSTLPLPLARHGIGVLLIVITCIWGCLPIIRMTDSQFAPGMPATLLLLSLWAAFYSLWHAAAVIAPAASNLTLPRRLTSLAAVAAGTGICFFSTSGNSFTSGTLLLILVATCMVEMGSHPGWHPGVAAAFARRGAPGRLAALIFHPGWATGVVFCAGLWFGALLVLQDTREWSYLAGASVFCFFPVCAGAPLLSRQRSGTLVMVLLALAGSLLGSLLKAALPQEFAVVTGALPAPGKRYFNPDVPLFWAGLALLLALPTLTLMFRRISRESNL